MVLNHPQNVLRRIAVAGPIGLGEAYQAGEWDSDDLPQLLTTLATHLNPRGWMRVLRRYAGSRRPATDDNSPDNARRNIEHHYDLSNDLFALFLDESMTYSSALFDTDASGQPVFTPDLLNAGQRRKINRVLDLAQVQEGTRLLEIGTGWGELAIAAAARGATVHTVTLSPSQHALASQRIAAAGVADLVHIELCDYRRIGRLYQDGYDAIVSVEMIEGVGEDYWPAYFITLDDLLAPGGTIAIQVITMDHWRVLATRNLETWINKYVFPGGRVPSIDAIENVCRLYTRLSVHDALAFGPHYSATLRLWRETFTARRDELLALGFDATFGRTWELYLSYCQAGFDSGYLDVHHLVLTRAGQETTLDAVGRTHGDDPLG